MSSSGDADESTAATAAGRTAAQFIGIAEVAIDLITIATIGIAVGIAIAAVAAAGLSAGCTRGGIPEGAIGVIASSRNIDSTGGVDVNGLGIYRQFMFLGGACV